MVADRAKPQKSAAPPRTLNVQKFAESRASELVALHSIVASRLHNDFRSQRNKRRRTTGHDNRLSRKRYRKKQKVGAAGGITDGLLVKNEKVPRHVRRRIELKKNPPRGFSASGDGTKRLRTHVWHAKRFTMAKLWGFYLPLGLHGRGKGSRALLKKSKEGVLVHDASYYGVVELEGPEDLLLSILGSVLVPFPSGSCDEASQNVLSGVTYGSAVLHHVGSLNSQSIGPVTYMWRSLQSNFVSKADNMDKSDEQKRVGSCALHRKLWLLMHPAAFREGYGVLESICESLKIDGQSVSCITLEGELAKLELIGLRAFQLIEKILHPITSVSTNSCALQKCSGSHTDSKALFKGTSTLPNEDEILTSTVISLMVNDPRLFMGKAAVSEPTFSEVLCTNESEIQGSTLLEGIKVQEMDSLSSSGLKAEESCQFSEIYDLWDAHQGILPPVEESFIWKEKYRQSLKFFSIADKNLGNWDTSEERLSSPFSQICPLMLLKNKFCDGFARWSIILPLSWVKAFWIAIVSSGGQAIGLRERHWIACEAGLPYFPSDFSDSKAYSCFMEMEEAINDKKAKLEPPALRPLGVPTCLPWKSIQCASQKESIPAGDHYSMQYVNCDIATLGSDGAPFSGFVARTSHMLMQFLTHFYADYLLLFPKLADGKKCLPMVIKDEKIVNKQCNGIVPELKYEKKLCFIRVHLIAYREGVFRERAVVCAPDSTDITTLTTRTEEGGGKCQIPESSLYSHYYQKSGPQLPEESQSNESCRPPIGFVTTGFVQGSKKPTAIALCEATWLARLREDQWKTISEHQRRNHIYVLVRNLRSTAYRLALATIVLEVQESDVEYM